MYMEWKAIAVICAAILTASLNGVGFIYRTRREKKVALRKALFNLMEIWKYVERIHRTTKATDIITEAIQTAFPNAQPSDEETEKFRLFYLGVLKQALTPFHSNRKTSIRELFSDAITLLSGELPVLASQINTASNSLDIDEWFVKYEEYLKSDELPVNFDIEKQIEAMARPFIEHAKKHSIQSIIKSLEEDLLMIARACSRQTLKKCKKVINDAKNWHVDRKKELVEYFKDASSMKNSNTDNS